MKSLFTFLFLFGATSLFAQSNCWTNLNSQNSGIPNSQYNTIAELPTGEFLIGSENGLIVYDGVNFNFLSSSDAPLGSKSINVISVIDSSVYIGTNNGYTVVRDYGVGSIELFLSPFTGLSGDTVTSLVMDTLNRLWIGTEEGVSVKSGLNWQLLTASVLPSNKVSGITALTSGKMAVATDLGVAIVEQASNGSYSATTFTKQNTSNGLINNNVTAIFEDSSENLWIGTQFGISKYDGTTWTKYTVSNTMGLASNDIRGFSEMPDGSILVATAFGLTTFDTAGGVNHLYSANGLAENILGDVIYCIADSSTYMVSNNQASGNDNGLHIYNGSSFSNFERENTGMPSNQPLVLAVVDKGPGNPDQMFSGFANGLYERGLGGIAQYSTQNTNLPSNSIRDLSTDDQGNLWALTNSGLSKWDDSTWTNFGSAQGLTSSYFISQAITDSTFIVSNTFSSGVVYYNGTSATAYKSFNTTGLATNTHSDFERMPNASAAIATNSGLSVFNGSSFTLYQQSAGLPSNNIKSLKYDWTNNILWLGHNNGAHGLSSMNPVTGTITNYSASAPSAAITDITVGGTDSVIYFIAGSSYYRFDAKIDSLSVFSSSNTPLTSSVLNDIEYLDGQLWIATGSGLHIADDFSRSAVALSIGDPATCDLDSVIVISLGTYSSILWSDGSQNTYVSLDTSATVSYVGIDANGCTYYSNTNQVTIFENPLADLFLTNDTSFCLGESNTITTWDYFDTYSWNNGNTGDSVYVTDNGQFYIEVMDTNGCFAISDTIELEVWKPYEEDSLCIVTVDTLNHNQLVWNKTTNERTFQYGIYKQNPLTGDMDKIADHPASGVLSVWSDVNSNAGITSTRYAISVIDSCGNESEISPIHKSMHLTINEGINGEVNLIWDGYEGIDIVTYEIWRGSSPKQMFKIDDVPAANFTYTDLNAPVGLLFYKIVVINPFICNPTVGKTQLGDDFGTSQSNTVDYALTDNVIIYPNPFQGQTRVVWSNPDLEAYEIRVYDAVGRLVVYEPSITQTYYDLYQNDLPSGVYAIELTNGERLLKTDFIIE